jgi:type IX secretion system substrate protein
MNKLFSSFLVLLMCSSLTYSQWSEQTSPITTLLYSVSAVDNNVVWACGNVGKVLRTTNGGATWDSVPTPLLPPIALYNIWGINATTAIVTGSPSDTYVFKTTNSGAFWAQVFSQVGGFIDAIIQTDASQNKMFMMGDPVGSRWSLWKSTNNGSTWDSVGLYLPQVATEAGWNNSLTSVYNSFSGRIWFGTSASRVYYGYGLTSGNITWTQQPTTGLTQSTAIWFNDSTRGMVGGGTFLQKTTNSGVLWAPVTGIPGTGSITGITGAGNDWWYVRGTGVYYTSDNGLTWATDYTAPGTSSYTHISKSRTGTYMWAVRGNGGISRSLGPIGIQPISNEIPVNYNLHQNYPNPFNPSTAIKFEIPKTSSVKLIIYDALGREVALMVNEELKAGVYEVKWDGTPYSSGIYLCKLSAGDFSSTMKIVLSK